MVTNMVCLTFFLMFFFYGFRYLKLVYSEYRLKQNDWRELGECSIDYFHDCFGFTIFGT